MDTLKQYPPATGVIAVSCACCGKILIINRNAYFNEPEFCRPCLTLPEATAEAMIMKREAQPWPPANTP
jgi:hypothetical protein